MIIIPFKNYLCIVSVIIIIHNMIYGSHIILGIQCIIVSVYYKNIIYELDSRDGFRGPVFSALLVRSRFSSPVEFPILRRRGTSK